jgi:hypothetical protein
VFDFEEIMNLDDFGVKKNRSGAYKGQIDGENGKRNGYGVYVGNDGRVYEGQWL